MPPCRTQRMRSRIRSWPLQFASEPASAELLLICALIAATFKSETSNACARSIGITSAGQRRPRHQLQKHCDDRRSSVPDRAQHWPLDHLSRYVGRSRNRRERNACRDGEISRMTVLNAYVSARFASPLRKGERTKVRGSAAIAPPSTEPSRQPSPLERERRRT